ncbi:MAG: glycoside hydrolase family 3 C-terminal domain-containing protein, partial [SAR324 cluster bacterium]|nr:glycoside hydrolase family 3 C-terminal domain-containing protein [SAR324 cluster bacterium]
VASAGLATVFPQVIGMAASFNTDLVHKVAIAVSDEARAKHHQAAKKGNRGRYFGLTYFTPNINIFRDPRWGRGHETYGEDPYLTSRMGVEFVKGLQGEDAKYLKLVSTPKHFAVHSGPESERHRFNAVVSQRDLRETYLVAFKACVQEAKAASVMGAYNRVNGEVCCASETLLQKILRQEWGFEGYVVSDFSAINDFHQNHKITKNAAASAAFAVKNGCELNCGFTYPNLLSAVKDGLITEDEIDAAVKQLFIARFKLGMFDPQEQVPYSKISSEIVNCKEHRQLARETARESIVLLKNENNLLPLDREKIKSIAVIGPNAMALEPLLGNYNGYSPEMSTVLQGFLNSVCPGTQVSYAMGCHLCSDAPIQTDIVDVNLDGSEVIIAVLGLSPQLEGEEPDPQAVAGDGGGDRATLSLPGRQDELLKYLHSTGKDVVLVLLGGSPIEINWADENIPSILMAWYPGEQGGNAIADVIFGKHNPAGRLPVTFYKSLEQLPAFTDYNMKGRTYRFMNDEPLYRFGHGLSYTTFEYSNLRLSKSRIKSGESVDVTVEVMNTGELAGDEVVQLYLTDMDSSVPTPNLHLEGFERVHLLAGEKTSVAFTIKPTQMTVFDEEGVPFIEPGNFRVSVGGRQPCQSDKPSTAQVLTDEFEIYSD